MSKSLWFRSMAFYIILLVALPLPVMSQENAGDAAWQESQQKRFSQEELAQLLAPIALYPDELISQVLMASTYPLEIVAADRWLEKNKELKGEELAKALEEQDWDPSVKSLVNFPTVLSMMSQKLEITSKLGDAFLAQEADVMATIQMLRKKAVAAGNLKSSSEQTVAVEQDAVIIEPATPQVVYVPAYDPLWVYGPWFYPAYPPYPYYYYPPPAYGYFGYGGFFSIGFAWGYAWGGCNWRSNTVFVNVYRQQYIHNSYINHGRYVNYYQSRRVTGADGRGVWRHDPAHRRGVAYRDVRTAERFGQSPARPPRSRDAKGFVEGRPPGRAPGEIRGQTGTAPAQRRDGRGEPAAGGRAAPPAGVREPAAGGRVAPPVGGRGPSTGVTPPPSGRGGSPAGAPRRDVAPGSRSRDGESARSASERGRSSREFSRGGGGAAPGGAVPGSVTRPAGGGQPGGGGRPAGGQPGGGGRPGGGQSGGGGRSAAPADGRGGGSRR